MGSIFNYSLIGSRDILNIIAKRKTLTLLTNQSRAIVAVTNQFTVVGNNTA
jgi:hypothetical protein